MDVLIAQMLGIVTYVKKVISGKMEHVFNVKKELTLIRLLENVSVLSFCRTLVYIYFKGCTLPYCLSCSLNQANQEVCSNCVTGLKLEDNQCKVPIPQPPPKEDRKSIGDLSKHYY